MSEPDRTRRQLALHLEGLRAEGVWALPVREPAAAADREPESVQDREAGSDDELTPYRRRPEELEEIAPEVEGCTLCRLYDTRKNVAFGVGNPDARLLFIGEGPGRQEDREGEPFVGPAGQLLNRIIGAMGLEREDVYIANMVKCRPPKNRNPLPDELASCRPYLLRQVAAIGPEAIVILGRVAAQALLDTEQSLGRLRGRFHDWCGIPVMCTYHPAYLLRTPADKSKTWDDIQKVMARLSLPAP